MSYPSHTTAVVGYIGECYLDTEESDLDTEESDLDIEESDLDTEESDLVIEESDVAPHCIVYKLYKNCVSANCTQKGFETGVHA